MAYLGFPKIACTSPKNGIVFMHCAGEIRHGWATFQLWFSVVRFTGTNYWVIFRLVTATASRYPSRLVACLFNTLVKWFLWHGAPKRCLQFDPPIILQRHACQVLWIQHAGFKRGYVKTFIVLGLKPLLGFWDIWPQAFQNKTLLFECAVFLGVEGLELGEFSIFFSQRVSCLRFCLWILCGGVCEWFELQRTPRA